MRFKSHIPNTAYQALRCWDKGKAVATIEITGNSPTYEQMQHYLVFEIIRQYRRWRLSRTIGSRTGRTVRKRFNDRIFNRLVSAAASKAKDEKINHLFERSLSDKQIRAAESLARAYLTEGYKKTIMKARRFRPADEIIWVTKFWPNFKYVDDEEDDDGYPIGE